MLKRSTIRTSHAPSALGAYSQAIEVDKTLYVSGQLGIDPRTGQMAQGVEQQARVALENLEAVLRAAKGTLKVV